MADMAQGNNIIHDGGSGKLEVNNVMPLYLLP
jgi:hypothetical protein